MKKVWLILFVLLLAWLSLFVGVHDVSVSGLMQGDELQWLLLVKTRVPRTISLILAGGMLSVCGKIMQHLMQNKFVSAGTIGMMDSARLGILLVMLLFPNSSTLLRAGVAFIFAYIGVLFFLSLSRILPKGDPMILPLTGVMFGNIIGAVASFFAYQFQLVQNLSSWLQGNFSTVMEGNYELIYVTVPVFIILYLLAYQMTVAGLGEELSTSLGMNYQLLQFIVFALVALGSSSVLIMVGNIPFLGVVVPNLVSLFYGDHLKNTMSITVIFGSVFMLICDILSRVLIAPYEIPVSVVVGMIGGGLFLFLLVRRRKG
ncbi:iron chelate uptake ABC transporter family permease subunit [Enterococcus saccharolyticus]|uniref:Iron ABC transporter permease n=1 Tax=Candidatus Enterococcus willemsii TaxID=1857215 RepID=A0ABQ6Z2I0_9ENTE|nr:MULTISPECIES: iron chelate uptake ABC transporter family permease subunit [Enterococcus]KAF1306003.1 iron ABC transporter permease [Enterococcus sp. CU12B]MCD5003247.1 iron chelate uptake ABC transporter family permease subunit [Enterococcus saccharolyticus]